MRDVAAVLKAEAAAGRVLGVESQDGSGDGQAGKLYVIDWKFCDDYINPEVYGMVYYGLELQPALIPVKELEAWVGERPDTALLPPDKLVIVGFGSTINPLRDYLTLKGRAFEVREFGRRSQLSATLKLVRVEAEGGRHLIHNNP